MRLLVVGATGYIGAVVTEHLVRAGHSVIALRRPQSGPSPLAFAEVRHGDLLLPETLTAAVTPDIDGVLNLATQTGDPAADAAATSALLQPLRGTHRPYVHASGIWVLGATGPEPADEDTPPDPMAIVADRPAIEALVLAAAAQGVRSVVIRPAITHGRGGGIPALLVSLAAAQGHGRYIGDASVTWPMVHVDDLAELFVAAVERAGPGTLLHGVTEPGVPVTDLARAAARAAGVNDVARAWPTGEAAASLGAPFAEALAVRQVITGARARQLLDWHPRHDDAVTDISTGSYATPVQAGATASA